MKVLLMVLLIQLVLVILTGLVYTWIIIFNKYFKDIYNKSKKEYIKNKLNEYMELSDYGKLKHEKQIIKYNKFIEREEEISLEKRDINLNDIELSERVKVLIDEIINVEIYSALRQYISLQQKYVITNIDTDVKNVSMKVFKALNPKLLESELVFTKTYIMEYIVGQTFNLMLRLVIELNSSLPQ